MDFPPARRAPPSRRHRSAAGARDAAVKSFERVLADVDDRCGEITWVTAQQEQVLRRTHGLIGQVLAKAKVVDETTRRANLEALRPGSGGPPLPTSPTPGADSNSNPGG
jgi:hypothetical protein